MATKQKKAISAMEFWHAVGTEIVTKVCERAGTKFSYFEHIKHGRKRPGYDLAKELSAAALEMTGHNLGVTELMEANAPKIAEKSA